MSSRSVCVCVRVNILTRYHGLLSLQGTASDLMKHAMISVDRTIAASWRNEPADGESYGSQRIQIPKLLMQIHDELIYEVPGRIGNTCPAVFIDRITLFVFVMSDR